MSTTRSSARTFLAGRSELALAAALAVLGVVAVVESAGLPDTVASRDPLNSSTMPLVVGVLLIGVGVALAIDVLRGGHGEVEGGEDIDLDEPPAWAPFAAIGAVFLANAVLIEQIGWPITGGLMFWGTATALGSRLPLRDALISFALSFGSYLLFVNVMGINLPAGILDGVV